MSKLRAALASILLFSATVEAEPLRRWPVDVPISAGLKEQLENDPAVGTSGVKSGYVKTRVVTNTMEGETVYRRRDGFWVVETAISVPGQPLNKSKGVSIYHGLTYVALPSNGLSDIKGINYQEQKPKSWPFTPVKISHRYTSDFGLIISCAPSSVAPGVLKNLPGNIYKISCRNISNVTGDYVYNMYYSDFLDLTVSGVGSSGEVSSIEFEAEVSDYSGNTYRTSFSSPDGRLF
ncbi:hypothetical protein [Pseudomonas putida]|uniref:hypothetical protein n=1 Tax=Pseudomonas putida TaxID=303 RepID=UPI0013CEEE36|nr:hypothetical protein [Pseudomonas putida]